MNPCLKHVNRVEFVVTTACTGRCRHCSQGDHSGVGECIDRTLAVQALGRLARQYAIQTVMTFGGEPLLAADTVCAIHAAAKELAIPHRQLITNGWFTRDEARIRSTAHRLAECGVNDILLSVDAFHQETIPLEPVKAFVRVVQEAGISLRTQPAWLVSPQAENPYNTQTRRILTEFSRMNVPEHEGNVVFASGNARRYLGEYFDLSREADDPYREDPWDVRTVSFDADGTVLNGNVYTQDMDQILASYRPEPEGTGEYGVTKDET